MWMRPRKGEQPYTLSWHSECAGCTLNVQLACFTTWVSIELRLHTTQNACPWTLTHPSMHIQEQDSCSGRTGSADKYQMKNAQMQECWGSPPLQQPAQHAGPRPGGLCELCGGCAKASSVYSKQVWVSGAGLKGLFCTSVYLYVCIRVCVCAHAPIRRPSVTREKVGCSSDAFASQHEVSHRPAAQSKCGSSDTSLGGYMCTSRAPDPPPPLPPAEPASCPPATSCHGLPAAILPHGCLQQLCQKLPAAVSP
eukprot:601247-Pelagomonas_calceolata.AAC.4